MPDIDELQREIQLALEAGDTDRALDLLEQFEAAAIEEIQG